MHALTTIWIRLERERENKRGIEKEKDNVENKLK